MKGAAENGKAGAMAILLTTVHRTGDAALIQKTNTACGQWVEALIQKINTACGQWVDVDMRGIAEKGCANKMARLLTAVHETGDAALKAATQASCNSIPNLDALRSKDTKLDQALKLYDPSPRRSAPALQQSAFC